MNDVGIKAPPQPKVTFGAAEEDLSSEEGITLFESLILNSTT